VNWRARGSSSFAFIGLFGLASLGLAIFAFIDTRTTITDIFKQYSTSNSELLVTVSFYVLKSIFIVQFALKKVVKAIIQKKAKKLLDLYLHRFEVAELQRFIILLGWILHSIDITEEEKRTILNKLNEVWLLLEARDEALSKEMMV
jgi:hypothetical protein